MPYWSTVKGGIRERGTSRQGQNSFSTLTGTWSRDQSVSSSSTAVVAPPSVGAAYYKNLVVRCCLWPHCHFLHQRLYRSVTASGHQRYKITRGSHRTRAEVSKSFRRTDSVSRKRTIHGNEYFRRTHRLPRICWTLLEVTRKQLIQAVVATAKSSSGHHCADPDPGGIAITYALVLSSSLPHHCPLFSQHSPDVYVHIHIQIHIRGLETAGRLCAENQARGLPICSVVATRLTTTTSRVCGSLTGFVIR